MNEKLRDTGNISRRQIKGKHTIPLYGYLYNGNRYQDRVVK